MVSDNSNWLRKTGQYSFDNLFKSFAKTELKLLDIGCGSAKFPSLLDNKNFIDIHCLADLLDISDIEKSKNLRR